MYTPILKWKVGEKLALQQLSNNIKDQILPLIELQPLKDKDKDTQAFIQKFEKDIIKYWGPNRPFLVDFSYFNNDTIYNNIQNFIETNLNRNAICIPVISLENYDAYLKYFVESKHLLHNGLAIRLTPKTLDSYDSAIKQIISSIQINKSSIILIIDFGLISEENIHLCNMCFDSIKNILKFYEYKQIIVTSTGFPTGFPSNYMSGQSEKLFYRTELLLWKKLNKSGINNILFGDYCCNTPKPLPADTSQLRPSAIIKYTTDDSWLIVKGGQIYKSGNSQYKDLSAKIVNSPYFKGKDYSYGDKYIYDCYNDENPKLGNPTTWVKVATNHHITVVVNQSLSL